MVQCQNLEPYEAEELFNKKYYSAVWKHYGNKLKEDSLNADLNYKMGVCYFNSRSQKEKAIHYLKRVTTSADKKTMCHALAFKLLGDLNFMASNFDDAILNYETYHKIIDGSSNLLPSEDVNQEIEMCKMAKDLQVLKEITASLVNQKKTNKKNRNQSQEYEQSSSYSISPSANSFTLKKSISLKKDINDKEFFDQPNNMTISNLKSSSKAIDSNKTKMETTVASSIDGQIILIYRDDNGEANLYTSVLNGNEWKGPEKLNKVINNKNWEPNEFISTDGNTLYFASKREGGFGGKDLYKSDKLANGDWGKAANMGPTINTIYDEEAPFMYPDGVTFYFSSNRNRPKGGFDNYSCSLSDSIEWTVPVNVGYPLHETDDTGNLEKESPNEELNKENYLSTFINVKKKPINLLKGKITCVTNDNLHSPFIEITIANNETGNIMAIYHPDCKSGKYTCIIPSGKNNNITFEAKGYLFHSENIDISEDRGYYRLLSTVKLEPITEGSKTTLNNIFFEDGKSEFTSFSTIELNRLLNFLMTNPNIKVEISGTVNKKCSNNELKIMETKILSVLNYLFEKGIDKNKVNYMIYKKSKKVKNKDAKIDDKDFTKLELKIIPIK